MKGTDVEGAIAHLPQHSPQHPFCPTSSSSHSGTSASFTGEGPTSTSPVAYSEMALGAFREGGFWSVCRGNYADDADAVISRDHSGAAAPALFL